MGFDFGEEGGDFGGQGGEEGGLGGLEGGFGEEFEMLGAVSDALHANVEARPDDRCKPSGHQSGRQRERQAYPRRL